MPLWLLVSIVVVGLAVVIFAVHFTGGSQTLKLSRQDALERFQEDYPGFQPTVIVISDEEDVGVLFGDEGRFGIIRAFGMRAVTRLLEPGSKCDIQSNGDTITFQTGDRTFGNVRIRIRDQGEMKHLIKQFRGRAAGAADQDRSNG